MKINAKSFMRAEKARCDDRRRLLLGAKTPLKETIIEKTLAVRLLMRTAMTKTYPYVGGSGAARAKIATTGVRLQFQ
jgi:hypothetical protein